MASRSCKSKIRRRIPLCTKPKIKVVRWLQHHCRSLHVSTRKEYQNRQHLISSSCRRSRGEVQPGLLITAFWVRHPVALISWSPHRPEKDHAYLTTLTSTAESTPPIDWGVIKMNCFPIEPLAALIIIPILISRLTESMKTSNSSRHRIGAPMASQRESSKQMVEKDFSPPDSVIVLRPLYCFKVTSGSTFRSSFFSLWFASS